MEHDIPLFIKEHEPKKINKAINVQAIEISKIENAGCRVQVVGELALNTQDQRKFETPKGSWKVSRGTLLTHPSSH